MPSHSHPYVPHSHCRAVAFLNPQLEQRYPPGVSYNTCPYSNVSNIPILPVREEQAQAEVCLAAPPTELEGTHGGFHQSSQLLTGNVLGLWNRCVIGTVACRLAAIEE